MRQRKSYLLILVVALAAVGTVAIAYAAMSQVLNVTSNKVTISAVDCAVGFTAGSVTGTKGGTSTSDITCGSATVTANSVTVADITLVKPDDSCTYAIPVSNTCPFAWKLTSLTATSPSGGTCTPTNATSSVGASIVCNSLVTYSITTDAAGTTPLKTNTTVAANTGSQTAYLVVKFTGSAPSSTAINLTNAKFAFTYSQN